MSGAILGAAQMRRSEEEARRRAGLEPPTDAVAGGLDGAPWPGAGTDPDRKSVHDYQPPSLARPVKRPAPGCPPTAERYEPIAATELRARIGLRLEPRVHGNGFVQLDLSADGTRRLHVFGHPDTPHQTSRTPIHDHVFYLFSEVLVGRMLNTIWAVRPRDRDPAHATHRIYRARYTPGTSDSLLEPTDELVAASVDGHLAVGEACRRRAYTVDAGTLHSTLSDGPTATLMTKIAPAVPILAPRVLVPVGAEPDNSFGRHTHDAALLWRIVEDVYPRWYELVAR